MSSFPEPWAPGKLCWLRCPLACQDVVTTPSHMAKMGLVVTPSYPWPSSTYPWESSASSHVGWAGLISPADQPDKHLLQILVFSCPPHRSLNYITHLQAPPKSCLEGTPDLSPPSPCEGHCEVNGAITPRPPLPHWSSPASCTDPVNWSCFLLTFETLHTHGQRLPFVFASSTYRGKICFPKSRGFFSHTMPKTQKILLS